VNVLSVAYPLLPAGPDAGGGAEQILSLLDRGLTQNGNQSIVIAAEGSCVSGELIATPAVRGEITEDLRRAAQKNHLCHIEGALTRYPIDQIHFHGLDFHQYVPETDVPMLATLHLPLAWYPDWIFSASPTRLNCVSRTQAAERGLPFVENGIDLERYAAVDGEREHLLWLGRICPEKGVHVALEVAHELDMQIVVAGPVHRFREHEAYFREKIQPLLDCKRKYIGLVGVAQKVNLLRKSICLLIPSLVKETSSLVAIEAAASGLPVVAFRAGALPEIVEDGVTGFVVDSQAEMAIAIRRIRDISSEICRARANVRFDARRMVDDYLKLYAAR